MKITLPNEGSHKSCKLDIYLWELEAGDTWNFNSPCTLTFERMIVKGDKVKLRFVVSDVKYYNPDVEENIDLSICPSCVV